MEALQDLEKLDKKKRRIKQKIYKCSFQMSYIAENNAHSTDTFSAVVAAWKADQKDPGSNLLWILLFLLYFKSEGCWFESRKR